MRRQASNDLTPTPCLFSSRVRYFYLFPFKLFWEFPVERFQMEILPDFIHLCNNLWFLESNAFGSRVLQGLIHQRQNGLFITQSHLHRSNFNRKWDMSLSGILLKLGLRTGSPVPTLGSCPRKWTEMWLSRVVGNDALEWVAITKLKVSENCNIFFPLTKVEIKFWRNKGKSVKISTAPSKQCTVSYGWGEDV